MVLRETAVTKTILPLTEMQLRNTKPHDKSYNFFDGGGLYLDVVPNGSFIPASMRYRDQLQRFRTQFYKAGLHGVHGLRHRYAQQRRRQLTGWPCPNCGGPRSSQLNVEVKERNLSARLLLSEEMGMAESKSRRYNWGASMPSAHGQLLSDGQYMTRR